MKQSELYPWIKTIMWNAIAVRYVIPPEVSLLRDLNHVRRCGCEREHPDLLIKTKYILCRSPILIAALVVIADCSGELVCGKSSSQYLGLSFHSSDFSSQG